MIRADVIDLIKIAYLPDALGNQIPQETARTVFADVHSVSQKEYYAAGEAGLKPAHKFVVFAADYAGEKQVEYKGTRYLVYRTYQSDDWTEIYTEERVGV